MATAVQHLDGKNLIFSFFLYFFTNNLFSTDENNQQEQVDHSSQFHNIHLNKDTYSYNMDNI